VCACVCVRGGGYLRFSSRHLVSADAKYCVKSHNKALTTTSIMYSLQSPRARRALACLVNSSREAPSAQTAAHRLQACLHSWSSLSCVENGEGERKRSEQTTPKQPADAAERYQKLCYKLIHNTTKKQPQPQPQSQHSTTRYTHNHNHNTPQTHALSGCICSTSGSQVSSPNRSGDTLFASM
jgi:hypothetical protein